MAWSLLKSVVNLEPSCWKHTSTISPPLDMSISNLAHSTLMWMPTRETALPLHNLFINEWRTVICECTDADTHVGSYIKSLIDYEYLKKFTNLKELTVEFSPGPGLCLPWYYIPKATILERAERSLDSWKGLADFALDTFATKEAKEGRAWVRPAFRMEIRKGRM